MPWTSCHIHLISLLMNIIEALEDWQSFTRRLLEHGHILLGWRVIRFCLSVPAQMHAAIKAEIWDVLSSVRFLYITYSRGYCSLKPCSEGGLTSCSLNRSDSVLTSYDHLWWNYVLNKSKNNTIIHFLFSCRVANNQFYQLTNSIYLKLVFKLQQISPSSQQGFRKQEPQE